MIDIALLFAFEEVESAGNPRAFLADRNGGSYGLNQLDLATVKDRGYTGDGPSLYDIYTNRLWAGRVRRWLQSELAVVGKYSIGALAAAYNEGLHGELEGHPDPDYVEKI